MPFVILTGASAAGKTTLAKAVSERMGERAGVYFFDSIGVPTQEAMVVQYGSIENWQRAKTAEWCCRLASFIGRGERVLLEGQMRIAFIEEALAAGFIANARIILVDCNDEVRTQRLHNQRFQPELATSQMLNWASYLRNEALRGGHEILDTSSRLLDDCVAHVCRYF